MVRDIDSLLDDSVIKGSEFQRVIDFYSFNLERKSSIDPVIRVEK